MSNLILRNNNNQVIKIKLFQTVDKTSTKILKLMDTHSEINKKHWVGVVGILSGINRYSLSERRKLKKMCGLQCINPMPNTRCLNFLLQRAMWTPHDYMIWKKDVIHSSGTIIKRSKYSMVFEKVQNNI